MKAVRNLAVIAGNGLSVAYSRNLLLPAITQKLLEDFESLTPQGDVVLSAIRGIATRVEASHGGLDDDFEKLVGAFETQAALIGDLESLIALLPEEEERLKESLEQAGDFARRVKEIGTGFTLKTILANSSTAHEDIAHMDSFFEALEEGFLGKITFGNLNYDPLVLGSMMKLKLPFCDLADARKTVPFSVINEEDNGERTTMGSYKGFLLREDAKFPTDEKYRIRLLHLHGSVLFWREKTSGVVIKIPLSTVRKFDLLDATDKQRKTWAPEVVLANSLEKPRRIGEYPFSLGYDELKRGLSSSDHWLLVGYSFRDASINDALAAVFMDRIEKPKVLVSTFGDDLSQKHIERCLGWSAEDPDSKDWLFINRDGASSLPKSAEWEAFSRK